MEGERVLGIPTQCSHNDDDDGDGDDDDDDDDEEEEEEDGEDDDDLRSGPLLKPQLERIRV